MTKKSIAIIGAGISGVSAGRMLQEKGYEVTLFEKNSQPGGLIHCEWVEGNLFHKVGGHVFNAKNPVVSNWFWQNFDQSKEFIKTARNAKIFLDGQLLGYPLENSLYALKPNDVEAIVLELLQLSGEPRRDPFEYPNFEAFLKGNFGSRLYELYFRPYNQKIWQADLSTVPMHWLEGKLPMPDVKKVIIDNILRKQETEMVHSTFYYPKKGGSQFIIDRLATNLEILNSHPVTQLQLNGKKWIVDGLHTFDAVVYTGDVRVLKTILTTDSQVLDTADAVRSLRSNGTSNLLCYTDDTDISWLYLPDAKTKAHRIIYTGNFSPENNTPNKRKTCVVEFSGKVSLDVMKEEIKNLPGNLEAIKSNYEPNSYVVQDKDTRVNIKKLKDQLSPLNFYLTGRFAEWEYYNMDKAIEASMNVANVYF